MIKVKMTVPESYNNQTSRELFSESLAKLRENENFRFLEEHGRVVNVESYQSFANYDTCYVMTWELDPADELMYILRYEKGN